MKLPVLKLLTHTRVVLPTFLLLALQLSGCATIKLGQSYNEPLTEQVIDKGETEQKVLLVNIDGILNDEPKQGLLSQAPSVLDSVLMQLKKAEKDKQIVAVLLKINSPGGGVTVSEVLYHELQQFKERTDKKIFVQMMTVAASGGVYVSMAADHIQAHPSTITGSVGVVSMSADISGTLAKIGAKVNVYKTGDNKDMGSPFKAASESDQVAFKEVVAQMADDFYNRVQQRQDLSVETMQVIKTARIFTGSKAKELGLVDSVGYLTDATKQACKLGGATGCKIVTYRFNKNKNATAYSPSMQMTQIPAQFNLIDLPVLESFKLKPGLYYLYLQ